MLLLADPIQMDIHAIGMIDRTIYCGACSATNVLQIIGVKKSW